MTPSRRQSHQRHGEPKVFQCVGFGDCNMVFTRSEHLARHARKHTGEKPFRCVIPGCERAFSRFDNMVQHTSTHSKHSDKKRTLGKKRNKTNLTKVVTLCINGSDTNKTKSSKTLEALFSPPMSSPSSPSNSSHILVLPVSPLLSDKDIYHKHQRLPSITESLYYQSPTTPSIDYFPPPPSAAFSTKSMHYHHHHHHPTFLPSPKELNLHIDSFMPISTDDSCGPLTGDSNSYWPASPSASAIYPSFLFPGTTSRKLSPEELALPIQDLSINHGNGNIGVDVTLDEFEALQGMSQLSTKVLALRTIDFGKPTFLSSSWSRHSNSFPQHLE